MGASVFSYLLLYSTSFVQKIVNDETRDHWNWRLIPKYQALNVRHYTNIQRRAVTGAYQTLQSGLVEGGARSKVTQTYIVSQHKVEFSGRWFYLSWKFYLRFAPFCFVGFLKILIWLHKYIEKMCIIQINDSNIIINSERMASYYRTRPLDASVCRAVVLNLFMVATEISIGKCSATHLSI